MPLCHLAPRSCIYWAESSAGYRGQKLWNVVHEWTEMGQYGRTWQVVHRCPIVKIHFAYFWLDPGGAGHVYACEILVCPSVRLSVRLKRLWFSIVINSQLLNAWIWDDGWHLDGTALKLFYNTFSQFLSSYNFTFSCCWASSFTPSLLVFLSPHS